MPALKGLESFRCARLTVIMGGTPRVGIRNAGTRGEGFTTPRPISVLGSFALVVRRDRAHTGPAVKGLGRVRSDTPGQR